MDKREKLRRQLYDAYTNFLLAVVHYEAEMIEDVGYRKDDTHFVELTNQGTTERFLVHGGSVLTVYHNAKGAPFRSSDYRDPTAHVTIRRYFPGGLSSDQFCSKTKRKQPRHRP